MMKFHTTTSWTAYNKISEIFVQNVKQFGKSKTASYCTNGTTRSRINSCNTNTTANSIGVAMAGTTMAGLTSSISSYMIEKTQLRTVSTVITKTTADATRITVEKAFTSSNNRSFASSSSSSSSTSFMAWYEHHLSTRPVLTKMITGSILWGVGDAVAQIVPQIAPSTSSPTATPTSDDVTITTSRTSTSSKPFTYDIVRTARASFFGFAIHAPTSHVHYNFLEYITVKGGFTGLYIPVFKTIMEQFVYWSWISNSIYHGSMEVLQTMEFNPTKIYNRIADVLWDTQKAQWAFWIPIQLINFQFTPVRHQLNIVLITSIVWTALLSAWYPPKPQQEVKQQQNED